MIAIYDRKNSYSERWIDQCNKRKVPFIAVDIFSSDLFADMHRHNVKVLLSHPPMYSAATKIAATSIIHACAAAGLDVFPSVTDFWHYDDKIAQKYLFEALKIQTPLTHVFYNKDVVLQWLETASFPIVFKLKSGAGSVNVSLIKSRNDANRVVTRMFRNGYPSSDAAIKDIKNRVRQHRSKRDWFAVAKRLPKTLIDFWTLRNELDWEHGYAYFQEYIPGNDHDTRVTVIGDKAFAFQRLVRPGDFRASGSGDLIYEPSKIDQNCIQMAFEAAIKLKTSCVAFDFIKRGNSTLPLVVEMSFAFKSDAVAKCSGHWTSDMTWQPGSIWPEDAILDNMLARL